MDLGQIKRRIEAGKYSNIEQAANDIRLVWSNCMLYNRDGSEVNNSYSLISYILGTLLTYSFLACFVSFTMSPTHSQRISRRCTLFSDERSITL